MADKVEKLAKQTLPLSVQGNIERTIDPFLRLRAKGEGLCSAKMRRERRQFANRMVADLWELGYRIRKLESLSGKHIQSLMTHWHQKGIVAGTLHTRLSMINVMCAWMGKRGIVKNIKDYLPADAVRRVTVATTSKAWDAKGISPLATIELATQIDERFGVMLALQHHFGLRVKESIELRPANALVDGGNAIEVHEGTKGGKLRRIPVRNDKQREVLAWARDVVAASKSKRIRWPDCTFNRAQGRFYHYMRNRLGITGKSVGVTAHGLRHGYAQATYEDESGLPSPIKGGALDKIDRETHVIASMTTSRALGHGRLDVTPTYYGSYGHGLRQVPASKVTYDLKQIRSGGSAPDGEEAGKEDEEEEVENG